MIAQKIRRSLFTFFGSLLVFMFISGSAHAAVASGCSNTFLGFPTWYKYLNVIQDSSGSCTVDAASTGGSTVVLVIMGIFDMTLYLAGMVAVFFIMYAGFKMLTAAGESQKIASGRTTLINALVGLVIAIISSQIVAFIAGRLS